MNACNLPVTFLLPNDLDCTATMSLLQEQGFYVVAHEAGAENPSIPTWANSSLNPLGLAAKYPVATISRKDLLEPRGAYQLLNVFSMDECRKLIELSETLGYLEDAAVSLPRHIRHNDNLVWVVDDETVAIVWQRVAHLARQKLAVFGDKQPLGINARFRFYRYGPGDYFDFHTDGAWPGSRVIDQRLVANAYPDRYSMMTILILLSDDFEGGATRFQVHGEDRHSPDRRSEDISLVDVRTPAGAALCFPHGMHLLHCVHSSEPIVRGTKYIIRTDMLFEI